ncbi:MAG: hypothetical protein DI527_02815 [Chelatococcus sp.]|nr:MAG: hypothetical protein DI527_02815 [Chelatococcus sp.]
MTMLSRLVLALAVAAASPVMGPTSAAFAQQPVLVAGIGPAAIEQMNVRVVSVDPPNHSLVVEQRGYRWQILLPEIFGDLRSLKPGDRLQINKVDGALVALFRSKKGSKPKIVYEDAATDSTFQNLPARYVVQKVAITGRFSSFDPATNTVSFVGPDGPRSRPVGDPVVIAEIKKLKRGDRIDAVFVQAYQILRK